MKINARNKGQRGEREIIDILQPIVDKAYSEKGIPPPELTRNLIQSYSGGDDIEGLPWLSIEVKRRETLNVDTWWEQTIKQSAKRKGSQPALLYRANHQKWRARLLVPIAENPHVVEVSLATFLEWFSYQLSEYLDSYL